MPAKRRGLRRVRVHIHTRHGAVKLCSHHIEPLQRSPSLFRSVPCYNNTFPEPQQRHFQWCVWVEQVERRARSLLPRQRMHRQSFCVVVVHGLQSFIHVPQALGLLLVLLHAFDAAIAHGRRAYIEDLQEKRVDSGLYIHTRSRSVRRAQIVEHRLEFVDRCVIIHAECSLAVLAKVRERSL